MMSDILFSMTQDERLASKIVRIASPDDVDEFRTELLSYDAKGEGSLNWRQAWQDKETQLWSVMEYHRTNAGQRLQTPVMNSVCFFDALHSCAEFERDRKIEGAAIATELFSDEDTKNMLHHLDVAELAGQPHDSNDMLHPAVEGQILTSAEACFDDHAYSVAKQTRAQNLLPVTALAANDNMLALLQTEHSDPLTTLSGQNVISKALYDEQQRKSLNNLLSRINETVASLYKAIDRYVNLENENDSLYETVVSRSFSILTLGLNKNFSPYRDVMRQYNALSDFALRLPQHESLKKEHLNNFLKEALVTFYMERASIIYKRYDKQNQGERALKKGLALVSKAAVAADLPEADAVKLKRDYIEGRYTVSGKDQSTRHPFLLNLSKKVNPLLSVLKNKNGVESDDNEIFTDPEKRLDADDIGQMVEGKGIYLGTWSPKDRKGKSLKKTFNLFAAPEDLTDCSTNTGGKKKLRTFNETVPHVAGLKDWHGHDGFNHNVSGKTEDEALYDALRDGSYNGGWFIPTRDIVHGMDVDGDQVQADNLYAYKDQGKLQGTFTTVSGSGYDLGYVPWYWSCTERRGRAAHVYVVGGFASRNNHLVSARLVRAELRPCL